VGTSLFSFLYSFPSFILSLDFPCSPAPFDAEAESIDAEEEHLGEREAVGLLPPPFFFPSFLSAVRVDSFPMSSNRIPDRRKGRKAPRSLMRVLSALSPFFPFFLFPPSRPLFLFFPAFYFFSSASPLVVFIHPSKTLRA